MPEQLYDFGMIGLGTMGQNLVYNMCDQGFAVAGYDKDIAKVNALTNDAEGKNAKGIADLEGFIGALKSPKVVMLLVPAGPIVDAVINELKPLLQKDDLIMDCGNSHFTDTDHRIAELEQDHIHFMGVGISGGESGARNGPSIMPGGARDVYERVAPMLKAVAAKVDGDACVTWVGNGSAGHYVKMVHNGIEYAQMQIIAEVYHLLQQNLGLDNDRLHEVFSKWDAGRMQSYLLEITADIFAQKDDLTSNRLIDMILDISKQNGTGKWTSESAMDLFVPIPAIDAAVTSRDITVLKKERATAAKKLNWFPVVFKQSESELINWVGDALHFSTIIAYAQGFALLQKASTEFHYDIKLDEVARIWRGGCIIRSSFLDEILKAFKATPGLPDILLNGDIGLLLETCQDGMRLSVKTGIDSGVPMPVIMASLAYFDSYRSARLPANLIQAQRDYFGAHTYERTDREGIFHTQWNQTNEDGSKH